MSKANLDEPLKLGDRVVTAGGIIGELVALGDQVATIKAGPGTPLQVLASSVSPLAGGSDYRLGKQVLGQWRLLGVEHRTESGEVLHPLGTNLAGSLRYTEDGYVGVQFMSTDRPKFNKDTYWYLSVEERGRAASIYFGYSGTWSIKNGALRHLIEICIFPDWLGIVEERFVKMEGNRMTLSTPPFSTPSGTRTAYVHWERFTPATRPG